MYSCDTCLFSRNKKPRISGLWSWPWQKLLFPIIFCGNVYGFCKPLTNLKIKTKEPFLCESCEKQTTMKDFWICTSNIGGILWQINDFLQLVTKANWSPLYSFRLRSAFHSPSPNFPKILYPLHNQESKHFFLFLTEEAYSHSGLQTKELGQTPLYQLAWVTNTSNSPDLNFEFNTSSTRADPQASRKFCV